MNLNRNRTLFLATAALLLTAPSLTHARPGTQDPDQGATPAASAPAAKTKRVMVVTFQQLDRKIKDNLPLGQEVADMVTQGLVQQGARVVERAELAAIEKERGLITGGAAPDKAGLQELAKLKGAAVAVVGKVMEFGINEKQGGDVTRSLVGSLKPLKNKVSTGKQYELKIVLDARLVSVETGDILAATTITVTEGTDESDINTMLSKSFGGGELLKLGLSAVLGNKAPAEQSQTPPPADKNAAWNESQAGKCTRRAVQQLVTRLVEKLPTASETEFEDATGLTLQLQGLADYNEATQLVEVIGGLKGVSASDLKSYTAEQAELTVKGSAKLLKGLVGALLATEQAKALGLKVVSVTPELIVLKKG